jgi:hypothetical protein
VEPAVTPPDAKLSLSAAPVEAASRNEDAQRNAVTGEDRRGVARKPLHWLPEGVFIVVSVVLGFGLTELGEYRNDRELAARMLASIRAEVEHNRATLAPFVPVHRTWQEALDREDPAKESGSAVDVLFAPRPTLPPEFRTNVPVLRRAAWDTPISTGASA